MIVFHVQAVMDSPDHCSWQLGLQVVSSQNSSQRRFFDPFGTHICMPLLYFHCNVGLELRRICNAGLEPRPIFFQFPILLFHISFLLHCHYPLCAGGLFHFKKDHAAYSIAGEDYEAMPPQMITDCSSSSSCMCWKIFTPLRALAPSNSPVPTLHLSRRQSSVSTL